MASLENYLKEQRNLDLYFRKLSSNTYFAVPVNGWIHTIRKSLGLTAKQLGKKIKNRNGNEGISANSVLVLEKSEIQGNVTINTLSKAAEAMNCEFVYAIIPKMPLTKMFQDQIEYSTQKILNSTKATMKTEDQDFLEDEQTKKQIAEDLIKGNAVWN